MEAKDKAAKALSKAKAALILDHCFFGTLACQCEYIPVEWVDTMAVDEADHVFYNVDFVLSLSSAEVMGVLAHEMMHPALGHLWRGDGRNHELWNMAADYAANKILVDAGFTLPKGALLDKTMTESAEEIYHKLAKQQGQQGQQQQGQGQQGQGKEKGQQGQQQGQKKGKGKGKQQVKDPGGMGTWIKGDGTEPKDKDQKKLSDQKVKNARQNWKAKAAQAMTVAKKWGSTSSALEREVQQFVAPDADIAEYLRDFIVLSSKNDYNWNRPNRKYLQTGFYLPALHSEELPGVVIAVDTSISIDHDLLEVFCSKVSGVLADYDTTVTVMYCNTHVQSVTEYTRADMPLRLNPKGGGGTRFQPVFDKVKELELDPCCLIYFTDLDAPQPTEPEYPVLWVTPNNQKGWFGVTVKIHF